MNNPYKVLDCTPDTTSNEVIQAFKSALKKNQKSRRYTVKDIMEAQRILLDPERRSIADFLLPLPIGTKRVKNVSLPTRDMYASLSELEADAFDSLSE